MSEKTGSVEQIDSGRWRLRMRLVGVGRKTIETFDTFEEADAHRKVMLDMLSKEEPDDSVGVAQFGEKVLTLRELSRKISDPGSDWSRWNTHFVDDPITRMGVKAMRDTHVDDWLDRLEAKGLARQTRIHCLNLLRTIMKAAKKKHLVRENPCSDIVIPKEKRTEEPWTYLVPEEQAALIAAAPLPEDAIVEFSIGAGLRSGELVTLHLADVHVDGEDPHIWVRYGKREGGKLFPTKSGKPRRVELFGYGLSGMKRWLSTLPSFCPNNPHHIAFPGARGGFRAHDHVLPWAVWKGGRELKERAAGTPGPKPKALVPMLELAAITRDVRWHDLRHTCASSLVSGWWGRTWSLREVQEMLGHESITTTERYAHLSDTATKKAARETRAASVQDGPRGLEGASDSSMIPGSGTRGSNSRPSAWEAQAKDLQNHILAGGLDRSWTKVLEFIARGEALKARSEAIALAHGVLSLRAVTLAHGILAGGPLATANAIELAELLRDASPGRASVPVRRVGGGRS